MELHDPSRQARPVVNLIYLRRLREDSASAPAWSPDGRFIVYGGSRVEGPLKAVTPDKQPFPLTTPDFQFRTGVGDRYRFLPNSKSVVVLVGEYRRQNFWVLNLETGHFRQLTDLKPGYSINGFDVSRDGKLILFDRVQDNSDIVLIDLKRGSLR